MGAPAATGILYRFSPPTDSWTGQFIDEDPPYYTGSITDTYDLTSTADSGQYTDEVMLWKSAANVGWIHRFKCTFSLSRLPDAGSVTDLFAMHLVIGGLWTSDTLILVHSNGKLSFLFGGSESTNAISTGVSYTVELYMDNSPTRTNPLWQLWIDDVLWLEDTSKLVGGHVQERHSLPSDGTSTSNKI